MTPLDFRNTVLSLKGRITDPEDRHALEQTIKSVAMYRTIGPVDADVLKRLVSKYTPGA